MIGYQAWHEQFKSGELLHLVALAEKAGFTSINSSDHSLSPPIFGAAVTKEAAAWMGNWVDGLITVHRQHQQLKEVVDAFRNNGGAGKPVYLKVQLSYAHTQEEAMEGAYDQWRTHIFESAVLGDMWMVEQFDAMGEFVQREELVDMVRISSDVQQHIDWIKRDMELGFERIILHNVNRQQELFINDFGDKVLPLLK